MASIQVQNVTKAYGAMQVLHGIDIDIPDGEFVILVGPSGCGKSTLLRMIAGLEDISGGMIAIENQVVNDLPPKRRDIAMVFQSYALYPHMTVEQNMGFSLKMARRSREEIQTKVNAAADILGLKPLLQRRPAQLSGGQRQRVAMGRAIVRDPKVFLFDEPLSNLDAQLRVQMRTEIKGLHQRLKTTTVYVTHDQVEAMTMADRIVVMNGGRIEQIGSPLELYDRSENLFVARFIGSPSMNLIEGTVERDGTELVFVSDDIRVPLPAKISDCLGRKVVLGIRPDNIRTVAAGTPGAVDATVSVIEPTGSETLVNLNAGRTQLLVVLKARLSVEPGKAMAICFDAEKSHLFDRGTGKRLTN